MADPFFGEIRIFAFSYPPRNWAYCDGAELPIAQYQALYYVILTTFGGNGQTSFMLPNLKGKAVMGSGNSPTLTPRHVGESGGATTATLNSAQAPTHNHSLMAIDVAGAEGTPASTVFPARGQATSGPAASRGRTLYGPADAITPMASDMLSPFGGGGGPHDNMQPYLGLNYCICLNGEQFPARP